MSKENILKAGKIARESIEYGRSLIKPGASYMAIYHAVIAKIKELGGEPAFPPQMAINECAAHFLPESGQDIIFSNELVSLDIGVHVAGFIGDLAITVDLSKKHQALVDAAQAGLDAATKTIKVGVTLGEVGAAIESAIKERGFNPIINLSGHGLGEYQIHTPPSFPNYANNSSVKIKPGMHFAIEPFATNGVGRIYDAGNPQIFSMDQKRPVRSLSARLLLKKMQKYGTLPFSIHDIVDKELSLGQAKLGLRELLQVGVLQGHAPLLEETGGFVAQAENTFYITDSGEVIVTTK